MAKLLGTDLDDEIVGGASADNLKGYVGADTLMGNGGADKIYGHKGNDTLYGGSGKDRLYGGSGKDTLRGDSGADKLYGKSGADTLKGGTGYDRLYGGSGKDTLIGGKGDDYLRGDSGADKLYGKSGADTLKGGTGYDRLYGGSGKDTLIGGKGDDTLSGGKGADTYVYLGNDGHDTILGFSLGYDSIDLSEIDGVYQKSDLVIKNSGKNVVVTLPDGSTITFTDVGYKNFKANANFVFSDRPQTSPTGSLSISGPATEHEVLTASHALDDVNGMGPVSWQWLRDGVDIAEATNSSYTLIQADVGAVITLEASYTDGLGKLESVTSSSTDIVINVDDPLVVTGALILTAIENGVTTIRADDLLGNVAGEGPIVSKVTVSAGTLTGNGDGTWDYTPEDNWHGDVTLSYTVGDSGDADQTTSATLRVEEKTFTIPYGDFAGTILYFNDPLLPFQSSLTGSDLRDGAVVHINLVPVWGEYTGAGITIGTPESVNPDHAELTHAYVYSGHEEDIIPTGHGSRVVGAIVADSDNGDGITGIAYDATISGDVAGDQYDSFDIITYSEGPGNGSFFFGGGGSLIRGAIAMAETGRDGLGSVWVNATGNEAANDKTTDVDILGSTFEMILVGQLAGTGYFTASNYGSALHISVPLSSYTHGDAVVGIGIEEYASEYMTAAEFDSLNQATGFANYDGLNDGLSEISSYPGGGSSLAAPHVSATVALMLEASDYNIFDSTGIGWRDVQEILAISALHTGTAFDATELPVNFSRHSSEHFYWDINGAGTYNGGGMHFNPDYGFGKLNVHGAVRLAESWQLQRMTTNMVTHTETVTSDQIITYGTAIEIEVDMSAYSDLDLDVVELDLDIYHDFWGELLITIISPDGTESIVVDTPGLTATDMYLPNKSGHFSQFDIWTVLSRAFWGENSDGIWTIRIEDAVDNDNHGWVDSIDINFKGDLNTDEDTYYFTDDWAKMNDVNGGIPVVDDSTGTNTINMAAVMDDVTLNMAAGSTSQIDGQDAFTLSVTTDISIAILGDGDDVITGADDGDEVFAMRGDDTIAAGDGASRLNGGPDNDTLTGGSGADVFVFDGIWAFGDDTITDFEDGSDMLDVSGTDLTFDDLTISQSGADTLIEDNGGNSITLTGITATDITTDDFIFG